jgi:hypothetical protein
MFVEMDSDVYGIIRTARANGWRFVETLPRRELLTDEALRWKRGEQSGWVLIFVPIQQAEPK